MNPMTSFSTPVSPGFASPVALPATSGAAGAYSASAPPSVTGDRLHFSGKAQAPQDAESGAGHFTQQQKLMGGLKGALKNIFNKKALIRDTLIGMVITLVTAWAPGSQLITIPIYMSIMAAFRAMHGFEAGYKDPTLSAFGKNKA